MVSAASRGERIGSRGGNRAGVQPELFRGRQRVYAGGGARCVLLREISRIRGLGVGNSPLGEEGRALGNAEEAGGGNSPVRLQPHADSDGESRGRASRDARDWV